MRGEYLDWWELVSEQFDRDIPFHIGADDKEVVLTTHDIRNEAMHCAWNQVQVRNGSLCNGYWEVDVRTAGTYAFELRRWPREAGYALADGIEGDDVEQRRDCYEERGKNRYSGGKALPIRWARLQIGERTFHEEVAPGDAHTTFKVQLPQGPAHIFPSFHCDSQGNLAPYYIYIRRLSSG